MTITPWAKGKALICMGCDMLRACMGLIHTNQHPSSSTGTGLLANHPIAQRRRLYQEFISCHRFAPIIIAFESAGTFGKYVLDLSKKLPNDLAASQKHPLTYLKLCQQIRVCIQIEL